MRVLTEVLLKAQDLELARKLVFSVGDEMLGRVVNALGAPIDGKGPINTTRYRPIENDAPGVVDRKSVNVPLNKVFSPLTLCSLLAEDRENLL